MPTLNTPKVVPVSWWYALYNLSYSHFCAEIWKFLLPWQQGLVWAITVLTVTSKQVHPKTPSWCKYMALYLLSMPSYRQFSVKFAIFPYHGNRVGTRSEQIFAYIGLFAVPDNPTVQEAQLPQRNSASAAHMEGRGTRSSSSLPLRPLWQHLCVWSNPKPATNVRQAHFRMSRAFKVILIGAGRNPERCVVVMCN